MIYKSVVVLRAAYLQQENEHEPVDLDTLTWPEAGIVVNADFDFNHPLGWALNLRRDGDNIVCDIDIRNQLWSELAVKQLGLFPAVAVKCEGRAIQDNRTVLTHCRIYEIGLTAHANVDAGIAKLSTYRVV